MIACIISEARDADAQMKPTIIVLQNNELVEKHFEITQVWKELSKVTLR